MKIIFIILAFTLAACNQPTKNVTKTQTFNDGIWEVSKDIDAGLYTTIVPDTSPACYWARLKDLENNDDSLIAEGVFEQGARGLIFIKNSDKAVHLSGGCVWKRIQ